MDNQFHVILQAVFEKAGITKSLKDVQTIAKNLPIEMTTKLNAASTRNDVKKLANEIAADLSKSMKLNLTGKDIMTAYDSMITRAKNASLQAEKAEQAEIKKTVAEINKKNQAREKANALEAKTRTSNANSLLTEEIQSLNKISSLRSQIVSQSSKGNTSQVSVLKEELALEQSHFNKLRGESSLYSDIISKEDRRRILKDASLQSELKVQQAQARATDSARLQAEKAKTAQLQMQANLLSRIKAKQTGVSIQTKFDTVSASYANLEKLGVITTKLKTEFAELKAAKSAFDNSKGDAELISNFNKLNASIVKVNNSLKQTKSTSSSALKPITELQRINLSTKMGKWLQTNTAAASKFGSKIQALISQCATLNGQSFYNLESQFKTIQVQAATANKLGKSFSNTISAGIRKFSEWGIATGIVMSTIRGIKNMWNSVIELDTALVDYQKTTTATASELEEFYYRANDVAKEMGVPTEEIVSQASAWSRLGYSAAGVSEQMAKLSSQFAAISPDMDTDTATNGLVSIMKAFDIDSDNVLDGIMSKVNRIGNTAATTNGEIVNMLTKSSSAMKEANNTLEETIALETAAVEITRDDDSVGTAFKTVSMRLRGYDEETESYTNDVEVLSGKIADLTKTASTPGGISLFTDDSKTEYKSTYQLLEEISKIYNQLSDKDQADTCLYVQKCA